MTIRNWLRPSTWRTLRILVSYRDDWQLISAADAAGQDFALVFMHVDEVMRDSPLIPYLRRRMNVDTFAPSRHAVYQLDRAELDRAELDALRREVVGEWLEAIGVNTREVSRDGWSFQNRPARFVYRELASAGDGTTVKTTRERKLSATEIAELDRRLRSAGLPTTDLTPGWPR